MDVCVWWGEESRREGERDVCVWLRSEVFCYLLVHLSASSKYHLLPSFLLSFLPSFLTKYQSHSFMCSFMYSPNIHTQSTVPRLTYPLLSVLISPMWDREVLDRFVSKWYVCVYTCIWSSLEEWMNECLIWVLELELVKIRLLRKGHVGKGEGGRVEVSM